MEKLNRIASFSVNHDKIDAGIYISRIDGDITTYDMRTRKPNAGDYMTNLEMHSFEHLFATFVRSGRLGERVIYFGPMGCQTGFYLLIRNADNEDVLDEVMSILKKIRDYSGNMPGGTREECGNYKNLDIGAAADVAARYLADLLAGTNDFKYKD